MSTWFDRLRGISQGRVAPSEVVPPDGSKIFLLGEGSPEELVPLTTGDNTRIRQIVDLTDWDFLKATMDTIGRQTGVILTAPDWGDDSAELFKFNFDISSPVSQNLVIPAGESAGFTFDSVGDITYPTESYSGAQTFCRGIPAGTVVPTHLLGVHTPPVKTPLSAIPTYTIQTWVNFDIDSHPSSWGFDFNLLNFYSESGPNRYGVRIDMLGLTGGGAHSWSPFVTHYAGTSSSGLGLSSLYDISTNQGWQMLTFVYDESQPSTQRIWMYLGDVYLGTPGIGLSTIPEIPAAGSPLLQYGGQNCWGRLDSCRMLDRVLSGPEVTASLAETTTPGVPIATQWAQQILIDDEVYATRSLRVGEERRWTDFIAPVRRLDGQHMVEFRMELQEV